MRTRELALPPIHVDLEQGVQCAKTDLKVSRKLVTTEQCVLTTLKLSNFNIVFGSIMIRTKTMGIGILNTTKPDEVAEKKPSRCQLHEGDT